MFVLVGIGETPDEIRAYLRVHSFDGPTIADMLVPKHRIEAGAKLPDGSVATETQPGGGWVFTCAHFDAQTRGCNIYQTRPIMCRDYPYGRKCEHLDCEWDKGRGGAHPDPVVFHADQPRQGDAMNRVDRRVHLRMYRDDGRFV